MITLRSCTHLLSANLDPDCLHANMRLLLCLTRAPVLARTFMEERGPHALLKLTKKSSFQGFSSLSALLFRHILENGPLLENGIESIIRAVISGTNQDAEVKVHGPGRRDLDFVLRRLSPCAIRHRNLFVDMFCHVARLVSAPPRPEDYHGTPRIAPIVLKLNPVVINETVSLNRLQRNLLNLLVDHLCANAFLDDSSSRKDPSQSHKIDEESFDSVSMPAIQYGILQNPRIRRSSYRRQVTDDDLRSEDMVLDVDQVPEVNETIPRSRQSGHSAETAKDLSPEVMKQVEEKSKEQLMFSQAAILRLLAEMIESYPSTSRVIIESTRKIKIDHQSHVQTTKVSVIIT